MEDYRQHTTVGGMTDAYPMKTPRLSVVCKLCGSPNVIRYGTYHGRQRLFCKDCKRKFADNDALPYMQTPTSPVGSAVGLWYEGVSLNAVRRLLIQMYNAYPSDSSVYRWLTKFTEVAATKAKRHKPNVGNTWVADQTVLDVGGEKLWFWDLIDSDSRFLLASHLSRTRTTKDAQKLMELATERAGKKPKVVVTDKLRAYLDAIELVCGAETTHVATKPFTVETNTNLIERFHGSLKDRTKVMRGLKDIGTARVAMAGWLLHYNYFRPHESLGKTPAEAAGIKFPYKNWQDVVTMGGSAALGGRKPAAVVPVMQYPRYTKDGYRIAPKRRKPFREQKRQAQVQAGVSVIR